MNNYILGFYRGYLYKAAGADDLGTAYYKDKSSGQVFSKSMGVTREELAERARQMAEDARAAAAEAAKKKSEPALPSVPGAVKSVGGSKGAALDYLENKSKAK